MNQGLLPDEIAFLVKVSHFGAITWRLFIDFRQKSNSNQSLKREDLRLSIFIPPKA